MSGMVSDLPIRYKRAVFTQKKLDRINLSRCDIYARSAMVSVLPPGIDVRKLQRSHSEICRVEPLSGLPSRLFFGLPIRFTYQI